MPFEFQIKKNEYLEKNTLGYFHQFYTGYNNPGNPNFINTLKNTFNAESYSKLSEARNKVKEIIVKDIPIIMRERKISNCICTCVPRAKVFDFYYTSQLMFIEAIKYASVDIKGVVDGTEYIKRIVNTYTTHLDKSTKYGKIINEGDKPYPGISKNTTYIDINLIKNKNVILVDDIYTKNVNIDEDFIQTLFDYGASDVIFYCIGYTRREL